MPSIQDPSASLLTDPVKMLSLCWPDVRIYSKQRDILYSVRDNDETIVVAGNMLGKDFITGYIAIWWLCSRSPARVITSSSGQTQLESVLWGEMRRFIQTSKYPLPIDYTHLLIRQKKKDGSVDPRSYLKGIVTNTVENLQGHHLERGPNGEPRALGIFDEASSIEDNYYNAMDTWAHRKLLIGNPLPCSNVFFHGVEAGDLKAPNPLPNGRDRYYRKVIRIKAEDSPNVKQGKQILPGVIDKDLYEKRRATWDIVRQTISLDGCFYKGAEILLYPPEWLNRAETRAAELNELEAKGEFKRHLTRSMGVDSGEGVANTVWTISDRFGIVIQISMKTLDTSIITGKTIALCREYNVSAQDVYFDAGGGGKQHADQLRAQGFNVKTIAFGEAATPPEVKPAGLMTSTPEKKEDRELRYVYKNRRAEMYGMVRFKLLDPIANPIGFGIPLQYQELRRQLSPLPLLYDGEGRIYLPPKNKKPGSTVKEKSITEILGCSPDEADSFVLSVFGVLQKKTARILSSF